MANVPQSAIDSIKESGKPVHECLYSLESMWRAIRRFVPRCYREAIDECMKELHESLNDHRHTVIKALPTMTPLTENEISLLGGPGTK